VAEQVFAGLRGRAVVVALEQPALVEGAAEAAHGGAQVLEGREALDPQDLFLEMPRKRSTQPLVSGW
jgi:hypothetical protein